MPRGGVTGGGEVSAGGLTLRSAIGQPVVGAVSNGLTLCSGYQCGPGAPSGDAQRQAITTAMARSGQVWYNSGVCIAALIAHYIARAKIKRFKSYEATSLESDSFPKLPLSIY